MQRHIKTRSFTLYPISRGVIFFLTLGLVACGYRQAPIPAENLPYKIAGSSAKIKSMLEDRFKKNGIQLIIMGQNFLISIPSNRLFPAQSPELTWESYAILNDVACYLRQYRIIAMDVRAYTVPCVSPRREHALTLTRSRMVADYLWSQGVDSRFIFTQGQGSDKPIVGFVKGGEDSPNARIEITFRNAVA